AGGAGRRDDPGGGERGGGAPVSGSRLMNDPPRRRALIVQHEAPRPPGLGSDWLAHRSARVDVLRIDLEDRLPDPRGYDLIVSLGSEFPAFDDSVPFVGRETK